MKKLSLAAILAAIALAGCSQSQNDGPARFIIQSVDVGSAQLADSGNAVEITFTPGKAAEFTKMTEQNLGKQVQIYFGDELLGQPEVKAAVKGGTVIIQRDSEEAARRLLDSLR